MKITIINFIKGILIGISVLVPGLSGGTTALILKIYEPILESVSNITKNIKRNILFISPIAAGGLIGVYLGSVPLKYLLEQNETAFSFIVIGIILGSVPVFTDSFTKKPFRNIILIIFGILATILFESIPIYKMNSLTLIFISVLMAVSLILPGISITNILLAFGLYDEIIISIRNFDILFLGKLAFFLVISSFALVKLLNFCYKKHPVSMNMIILGMVLGSVKQVSRGITQTTDVFLQIILLVCGFLFSLCIIFIEKRTNRT